MDVVFALDSSYGLKPSDFEQQKGFIITMIDGFTISDSKTHVGLITVSETARKNKELTENNQLETLKDTVNKLQTEEVPPSAPTRRLRDMSRKAFEIFKSGGRSGVRELIPHLLLLFFVIMNRGKTAGGRNRVLTSC